MNCQFAVHYFFKSEQTLNNFVKNVKQSIKPGGYLVITCIDGEKLRALTKGKTYDSKAVNIRHNSKNASFVGDSVTIQLKGTKYFKNKPSDEYLINVNKFIEYMKSHSFEMSVNKSFETYCTMLRDHCAMMSNDEATYSFLNTCLVFKFT